MLLTIRNVVYSITNMFLYEKKLTITASNTYEAFIELNNQSSEMSKKDIWYRIVDAFQTSAINATNDYKLKHLVKIFSLSGELLIS
jgi:site-specific recombinase XerD